MYFTDKELNDAEEGVTKLSEATGIPEDDIVRILEMGFGMHFSGQIPPKIEELMDELTATFDAY